MTAFDISMIAEDLRQIKGYIDIIKGISFDALNILKTIEDKNDDMVLILQKLNQQLIGLKAIYELYSAQQSHTHDTRIKAT